MCGVPQRNCKCKRKRRGMKTTQTQMQMQVQASTQVMTNFNFFFKLAVPFAFASHNCEPRQRKRKCKRKAKKAKFHRFHATTARKKNLAESVRKFPLLFDKRFLEFRLYQTRVRHFRHLISCANYVWYLQASFSVI